MTAFTLKGIQHIVFLFSCLSSLSSVLAQTSSDRPPLIRFFRSATCAPGSGDTPSRYQYSSTTLTNITDGFPTSPTQSYCVVRGAWRVEFAWLTNPSDFNVSLGDGCEVCYNNGLTRKRYGVIKAIGGPDITKPSFSLFTGEFFTGEEIEIRTRAFSFNTQRSFMSFGFTSFGNWTWQLYNQPNYRGSSKCYGATTASEVTLESRMPITVGSIRLGCSGAVSKYKEGGFILTLVLAVAVPSIIIVL